MNNITRLQLIEGPQSGFLDIKEGVKVPLNFSISDIRDISSRSGMFSKTIALAGTKNNNNLLNNYFDVNIVAGTYDVNKRQKVAIVQNGIILRDNCYMRLLKVKKKQSVDANIDEYVEYEVQVTDELGDFFKEVGNKEVKELGGWERYNHTYGVDAVVNSFDHTVDDGYKYTLPWVKREDDLDYDYIMNDLMPGIYAKQIFDRIHILNGFSYEWATIDDEDTQFDKSILPYAGDKKKLAEEYIESVKIIADRLSVQETGKYILGDGMFFGRIESTPLSINNKIKDNSNRYNPTNSIYSNNLIVEAPDSLNYNVKINYDVVFVNDYAFDITLTGNLQRFTSNLRIVNTNGTTLKHSNKLPLTVNPANSSISKYSSSVIRISHAAGQDWTPGETVVASGDETFVIPLTNLVGTEKLRIEVNANMENFLNSQWRRTGTSDPVDMKMKIVINSIKIEITPDTQNGLMPGTEIDLKNFLPNKMKQSEFLKTIYQKYNLYVEVDPDNPSKLIYTSRDKFYDSGEVKDWTKKLDKKREQELYFIPDITTKKMILSYKDDDKDSLLDAYRGETAKTFGQVDVIFENENIKGEERKEEVFSPTINMETEFGAVLPVLNADFKMNQRILQDGGKLTCQEFILKESELKKITSSFYPHLSMFNKPYNPTFSTEYKQSSYYAYNPGLFTENNLYTLHWRRTLAQINDGKMLKAYFWLTEEDIQGLRMNDKIKVNNTFYYINSIIDYDANSNSVTKVELLTVEDDLRLPRIDGAIKNIGTIKEAVLGTANPKVSSTAGGFFNEAISDVIKKRYDNSAVLASATSLTGNLGMNNVLTSGFRGVVIGDNLRPSDNGFYVNKDTKLSESGLDVLAVKSESLIVGATKLEDGVMEYDSSYIVGGYLDDGYFDAGSASVGFEYDEITDKVTYKISADKVELSSDVNVSGDIGVDSIKINNIGTTTPVGNLGYDIDGNVVIGEGSSMDIVPKTYIDLKDLKDNNILVPGVRYYITDRDIWIDALDTDKLSMECKRHFRIVKDEYYTPHTTTVSVITNNYLGIYGQSYTRGSTPTASITNKRYAIWGGRMWERNISGADTPGTSNEIIQSGWTMVDITDNTFYESKIFDIKYNFDDDLIWEQSDERGNIVKRFDSSTTNIDITDWGNSNIYNNENFGIFNNFRNATTKATVYNNTNIGAIYSNSNNGNIQYNSNSGVISRNSNNGDIRSNSNKDSIFDNSNSGNIQYNSNSAAIYNNLNSGNIDYNSNIGVIYNNSNSDIYNNSNNGNIQHNSNSGNINNNSNTGSINNNLNNGNIDHNLNTGFIQYNSNSGHIYRNSNNGYIQYNSNNGDIHNNSNNGYINDNSNTNGTTSIRFNTNTGWVRGNRMNGSYLLEYNNNNGNVGVETGTINRNGNITGTQVNKP